MNNLCTFRELRKGAELRIDGKEVKIAVLGNCSTQFLSKAICGSAKLEGINANVFDADYDQIDAQLLDRESETLQFAPEYVVLWLATEKLYEGFLDSPLESRESFAEDTIAKIERYWNLVEKETNAKILQFNFPEINDRVCGNFSGKIKTSFIFQLRKLNYLIEEGMESRADVFPIDILTIQNELGQERFFDAAHYYNAKMTVSMNALPHIAKAVVDVLKALSGKIKKCVALDLDNTLWGGVIGDDGIDHIEIGEYKKGHVFSNLQRWFRELREYGILLCICSKNNEDIAKGPFESHPDMVLRLPDISLFVANWDDKATNIKIIQETLNIGMDSIIFVDDNPFERNLVKKLLPEVEVPELPEDPSLYLECLWRSNYFENVSKPCGGEQNRTQLYQTEFTRKKSQAEFESFSDYLKSLQMVGSVRRFDKGQYPRIAQLTQRSNQFNLRTVRYAEDEIGKIAKSNEYIPLYYMLSDKFGEYGLIAVAIIKIVNEDDLFIDTWLMSCRVLKRGMEEFTVNCMVREAKRLGYKRIIGEYIPTAKNSMVSEIYNTMGFREIGSNRFSLDVNEYEEKLTYISENEEDVQ